MQNSFLDIFRYQAEKAGHDLFTAKRGLYYSVLDQGSRKPVTPPATP